MFAANLAAAWAPGRRVALLDIDPQRSLKRWHALRTAHGKGAPTVFSDVSGWRLQAELDRLKHAADIVLIDTPPQIDADATRAIRAASLVLIPLQPSRHRNRDICAPAESPAARAGQPQRLCAGLCAGYGGHRNRAANGRRT